MAIHISQTDKGNEILNGLLLRQYHESPNLLQYFAAYIDEMDLLFKTIEDVHFGRLLDYAIGEQLDVIGRILQQTRDVVLPTIWFGFDGASPIDGFAPEADPTEGGVFLSESQAGVSSAPLTDEEYRKLLKCKGSIMNSEDAGIETMYSAFAALLGFIPATFQLTAPVNQELTLTLSDIDTTTRENQLIIYTADKFLVPAGTVFNTVLV